MFLCLLFFVVIYYAHAITPHANSISACNFDMDSHETICTNRVVGEDIVRYFNVQELTMCEYHYCVTFIDNEHRVVCSGYVWTDGSKTFDPMRLNKTASNVGAVYDQGQRFKGYNVYVDRFEQNVESWMDNPVRKLACDGLSMCAEFENGSFECIGLNASEFSTKTASAFVGFFSCHFHSLFWYLVFLVYMPIVVRTVVLIPVFVLVVNYVWVLGTMYVKVNLYHMGSILGIVTGYKLAETLLVLHEYLCKTRAKHDVGEEVTEILGEESMTEVELSDRGDDV